MSNYLNKTDLADVILNLKRFEEEIDKLDSESYLGDIFQTWNKEKFKPFVKTYDLEKGDFPDKFNFGQYKEDIWRLRLDVKYLIGFCIVNFNVSFSVYEPILEISRLLEKN